MEKKTISWENPSSILAFVYIFIMFTLVLLYFTLPGGSSSEEDTNKLNVAAFYVEKLNYPRQNCADQPRLCGTNNDCFSGCFNPNEFVCHKQYCEQKNAFEVIGGEEGGGDEPQKCYPDKGVVLVLHSDGKFRCTSLHSQYFDAQGQQNSYVCQGGVLQWNESIGTFECTCGAGKIRVVHESTPFIPRCYPARVLALTEFRQV